MSGDNGNGGSSHERRGSVTSAAFSNLFHRSNSTSAGNGRESAAALAAREQRRRLSVTTLGLSGTSPPSQTNTPFGLRRGSISTNNSEAIDESAVEDDDYAAKPAPSSPFARRISFGAQAMRNIRTGPVSPGSVGRPAQHSRRISYSGQPHPPPTSAPSASAARRTSTSQASTTHSTRSPSDMVFARPDNGYNWSEQLRSRAESSLTNHRPSFGAAASVSPSRLNGQHDRAKSVSDMPPPPQQAAAMKPRHVERPKPDHMQERILKGDFYMD
ncbi:hypothetical protein F5X96DRAFT_678133 [Biscogniauxia mediterranea]|nr:hypothetical protein F5X96DRAFT_678133 [Biscogniauxia mediterranea]